MSDFPRTEGGRFAPELKGLEPKDSAVIARVTETERKLLGTAAELWEMSVSAYVRFAALRYTQQMLQRTIDMTEVDVEVERSRLLTQADRLAQEASKRWAREVETIEP
jgi:uncharacterized protein (DUF1778 family)